MDFMTAVQTCLSKYATFSGRASRPEFWWFSLATVLAGIAASILGHLLFGSKGGILAILVNLGTFLPLIAATVRRLHDTDRSGWWFWIQAIPLAGWVVLIIFNCQDGTRGRNSYG